MWTGPALLYRKRNKHRKGGAMRMYNHDSMTGYCGIMLRIQAVFTINGLCSVDSVLKEQWIQAKYERREFTGENSDIQLAYSLGKPSK